MFGGIFICGLLRADGWCNWWPHFTIAEIVEFIRASGFRGVAASIAIMIIHSFIPFPAEFVAIANGIIYGAVWGTVITWIGAMSGAFLAFGLVRIFGRPFVSSMLNVKNEQKLDTWIAKYGISTLFVSRFIPVIAFNLINYAAGLAGIPWWTFAWTTGLGILPMIILMVIMGRELATLSWLAWFFVAAAALILWLMIYYLQRRLGSKKGS